MRHRHELSDTEWARLQPLLPPRKPGRPRHDDRRLLNGILWKLATGVPWRDLPERYGPWQTVYTRFRRWTRAGVWDRLVAAVRGGGGLGSAVGGGPAGGGRRRGNRLGVALRGRHSDPGAPARGRGKGGGPAA